MGGSYLGLGKEIGVRLAVTCGLAGWQALTLAGRIWFPLAKTLPSAEGCSAYRPKEGVSPELTTLLWKGMGSFSCSPRGHRGPICQPPCPCHVWMGQQRKCFL